ncbi:hypothetical protein [Treponema putidum]|uniref:hypothetical protein n=1 Tax=Treponema putidum TaxID=221027 RepID=UPI003D931775
MAYTNEQLGKALEDLTAAYNNFIEKAKDAAIAAMGDTVIAQIKQDAKDFIASELAAQKAALEQAIEQAKTALHNSAIQADTVLKQTAETKKQELAALITAAENTLQSKITEAEGYINAQLSAASEGLQESINTKVNKAMETAETTLLAKINSKFIEHYQKGYIQTPGMPSPLEDTSMHYEGYSWYEVNYDGNFFRAKGRNANPFSSKKLTKEQTRNGDYIFQDDEQVDTIRNIAGFFEVYTASGSPNNSADEKLFHIKNGSGQGESYQLAGRNLRVELDVSNIIPTAEENRPRNLTFIYWVLVKNE